MTKTASTLSPFKKEINDILQAPQGNFEMLSEICKLIDIEISNGDNLFKIKPHFLSRLGTSSDKLIRIEISDGNLITSEFVDVSTFLIGLVPRILNLSYHGGENEDEETAIRSVLSYLLFSNDRNKFELMAELIRTKIVTT